MMAVTKLLILSVFVASSMAFLFNDPPTATSDGREIDESCLELAEEGSCEFYTCFERRLPCGRDWYMLRTGHYYCNKMERVFPNFTPEGQRFLTDAKKCMTRSLKDMYEREYVDCHELEHHAVSAIAPCFTDNGFCDVFEANSDHFMGIFEFRDLFTRGAGKVWRAFISLATQCGGEALREFSSDAGETVVDAFNGLFQSLSNSLNTHG